MIAWRAPSLAGSRREDGFTLIEILVSLALLTFIAGLLAGALQFARGTWDAAAKLDRHAGHDMAEGFLRARLGEAMPLYERAVAGTVRVAFSGTADTLSFVAPAPNGPLGTGLYQYKLGLAAGAGRNVLMVGLSPYVAKQTERGAETGRGRLCARHRREVLRTSLLRAQPTAGAAGVAWHLDPHGHPARSGGNSSRTRRRCAEHRDRTAVALQAAVTLLSC